LLSIKDPLSWWECTTLPFPSLWGQKDQEYMIIILLYILGSAVGPKSTLGKIWVGNYENWPKIIFFPALKAFGGLANPSTNNKILA
jgi:hypothetical protein